MKSPLPFIIALTPVVALSQSGKEFVNNYTPTIGEIKLDSMYFAKWFVLPTHEENESWDKLTEKDYVEVAAELGVEVPAIKAVVDIETGRTHQGFWKKGKALINFDISIYRQYARRHGVDLNKARKAYPIIFNKPNIKKYGSQQAAQYARLDAAIKINRDLALESCFWGMFQVGGFNWKLCGCRSVDEFCQLINTSERDQLELFAAFCKSRDLVKYIKSKDWANFALRYNGAGYKKLSYDTKMAAAYRKFKNQ